MVGSWPGPVLTSGLALVTDRHQLRPFVRGFLTAIHSHTVTGGPRAGQPVAATCTARSAHLWGSRRRFARREGLSQLANIPDRARELGDLVKLAGRDLHHQVVRLGWDHE